MFLTNVFRYKNDSSFKGLKSRNGEKLFLYNNECLDRCGSIETTQINSTTIEGPALLYCFLPRGWCPAFPEFHSSACLEFLRPSAPQTRGLFLWLLGQRTHTSQGFFD
jgi:hypothetical protein